MQLYYAQPIHAHVDAWVHVAVVTRHSTSRHCYDTRDFGPDCTWLWGTLRGFKACTTFGRKYCWASRNVTEAVVSSPMFFWILPRLRSIRHDVYERVTSRRCRAYGDTRRERHAIVAIFNACDWRMPRLLVKRQFLLPNPQPVLLSETLVPETNARGKEYLKSTLL